MPAVKPKSKPLSEDIIIPPFTIEADHPRNADLLIQSIPECRLRSNIKPIKQVFVRENGKHDDQTERPEAAGMMTGLPSNLSGMRLSVDPQEGTYEVTDPLKDDEPTLERIGKVIQRNTGIAKLGKIKAARDASGKLDKDRMKTLIREIYHLVQNGHAKVVKGVCPEMKEIEQLPGDFLLNASNENNWRQPRYEKDLDEWDERINKLS